MTSVEDRLPALLEAKAAEAGHSRPLSSKVARSAARARFVRRAGAPMLAFAGMCVAVGFVGESLVDSDDRHGPSANAPVPAPQLSGTSGTNEWRLTAVIDGREHCLIVHFSYEGREIDKSHNCGVPVDDVHPHMGPGVTTSKGGGGMLALHGQVGPDVDRVSVDSEAGRQSARAIPIDWDAPRESGFYVFFLPDDLQTAVLSTYDSADELIRDVSIEFIAEQAHIVD